MSNNGTSVPGDSSMPGFDRTGPRGRGPMTGGGFGYCRTAVPANRSPDESKEGTDDKDSVQNTGTYPKTRPEDDQVYGRGRGGIPCGGGFGYGGGRRRRFWR